MKIAVGEVITVGGTDAIITKVSRMPQMIRRGIKFSPTMRVYYNQGKKKGHCDCEVPKDIEVVFGPNAAHDGRQGVTP